MLIDNLRISRISANQNKHNRNKAVATAVEDLLQTFIDILYRELCYELEKTASSGRNLYVISIDCIEDKIKPWKSLIQQSDKTTNDLTEIVIETIKTRLESEGLQTEIRKDWYGQHRQLFISWN